MTAVPRMPLNGPCIVFMHGPALTLKTTIARFLHERFNLALYSTHQFGPAMPNGAIDPGWRANRYQKLFEHAAADIAIGSSVILDGRFSELSHRMTVCALARKHQAHVIAIKMVCDSRDEIEERARRRAGDPTAADREFSTHEIYEKTAREVAQGPIEHDPELTALRADLLVVQTGTSRNVQCPTDASADARNIAKALLEFLGPVAERPSVVVRSLRGVAH